MGKDSPAAAKPAPAKQVASVGRIVHFRSKDSGWPPPNAAIITHVLDDRDHKDGTVVNLSVFQTDGTQRAVQKVPFGDIDTPHSWWWPPRA